MAEFQRKIRYIKYGSNRCKQYLRYDFQYSCAYCSTSEAEIISGHKYFEIDHFIPQTIHNDGFEVHRYDNLFYSCVICNGAAGKSNSWSADLLNPCVHDIYGVHISTDLGEDFKYIANTNEGQLYIDTIKLNQKSQRRIRSLRQQYYLRISEKGKEINDIIQKLEILKNMPVISHSIIEPLERIVSEFKRDMIGPYYNNLSAECTDVSDDLVFEKQLRNYLHIEKIYFDFDIDYEVEINGEKFLCYHRIYDEIDIDSEKAKQIRIPTLQLSDWAKHIVQPIVVVAFSKLDKKIYLKKLSMCLQEKAIEPQSQLYTVWIRESDLLAEPQPVII